MDSPLNNYLTGMCTRLAFAPAVSADAVTLDPKAP
jgi:ABC-type polysaccharide/polyol phosphate transport system ATPase subunit